MMKANHNLVYEAGKKICEEFEIELSYPESMIGAILEFHFLRNAIFLLTG
jgi:hypothetical protein